MSQVNRISKAGLDLIKGFEGLRRRSEPLPGGGWIVGYGHTRSAREGVEVTEREAEYLLRYDLQDIETYVSHHVHAPLDQNEFDALVSFCWNIGKDAFATSDVLNYVNAGEMLAAAESFPAWRKARIGGRLIVVDALVRRRSAEKNLFLSHPSGPPAAPSLLVKPELDVAASVLALSDGALSLEAKMNPAHRSDTKTAIPNIIANDQFERRVPTDSFGMDAEDVDSVDIVSGTPDDADTKDEVATSADIDEDTSLNLPFSSDENDPVTSEFRDDNVLPPFPEPVSAEQDELPEDTGTIWDEADLDEIEDEDDFEPAHDLYGADSEDEDDDTDVDLVLDDIADDVDSQPPGIEDTLSRAMAASFRDGDNTVSEDLSEDEVLTRTQLDDAVDDLTDIPSDEPDALPEVFQPDEDEDDSSDPTNLAVLSDMADTLEDEITDTGREDDGWNAEAAKAHAPETAFESFSAEAHSSEKRLVLNDIDYPNGMTADEIEALDPETTFPNSGALEKRNVFLSVLPFLFLAVIGLVMMGLGLFDWWGLLQSDRPINENELYAGPFLTLIGGFGLVFGLYFTIRKLVVTER